MIEKILVVDDSEIIRGLLAEVLREDGYQVDMACNGVEAIEMLEQDNYDLVFCDVHMPRQNGLVTARRILQLAPQTKIVMTDSYPDTLAKEAQKEGALGCICKPFDLGELRSLLEKLGAPTLGKKTTVKEERR
ncbi:MAG: response regulator [candidate division Zixibacteria bacterium]|nr:response regulator [candidate division Zixibacteria bacterium]